MASSPSAGWIPSVGLEADWDGARRRRCRRSPTGQLPERWCFGEARRMTRRSWLSAALAVVAALTFVAGARADIVATLPPGSYFTDVSVAADRQGVGRLVGPDARHLRRSARSARSASAWPILSIAGAAAGRDERQRRVGPPRRGRLGLLRRPRRRALDRHERRSDRAAVGGCVRVGGRRVGRRQRAGHVRSAGELRALGLDGSKATVHYSAPKAAGQSNCAIDRIAAAADNTLVVDDDCHRLVRLRLDGSVVETIPLTGALAEWADFPRVVAGRVRRPVDRRRQLAGPPRRRRRDEGGAAGDRRLPRAVGGCAGRLAVDRPEPGMQPPAHHGERRPEGRGADHGGGPVRRSGRDAVDDEPQPARPRRACGRARIVRYSASRRSA